jgi:MFS family permease
MWLVLIEPSKGNQIINRDLIYLFILNIAFGVSIQLINPLFPLFLEEIGAKSAQNALVISLGSLVATSLMFPSGLLIDKIGKKTLLISSTVGSSLSIFLLIFTKTWIQVIPVYILFSAAGALFVPTRMAMITEHSEPKRRGTIFGLMNMAWPIAGIVSPLISGYLIETTGWRQVFLFGAAVNTISLIPGLRLETKKIEKTEVKTIKIRELFTPELFPILFSFFGFHLLMTTALGGVNLIIPLYLATTYGLTPYIIGWFFTAQSILNLITQIPSGRLADKYGRKKFVLACILFIPLLYTSWHFIDDWKTLLIINSILFGLWSMTWPGTLALLSESVPTQMIGASFGVRMTGVRLGFTLGPIVSSFFYSNYSNTSPFLVAAIISVFGVLFAFTLKDEGNRE